MKRIDPVKLIDEIRSSFPKQHCDKKINFVINTVLDIIRMQKDIARPLLFTPEDKELAKILKEAGYTRIMRYDEDWGELYAVKGISGEHHLPSSMFQAVGYNEECTIDYILKEENQ